MKRLSKQPISFWGGLNPKSGEIIDVNHELHGENVSDKIFIFPHGRGSSTASAILFEMVRVNTSPAAIINSIADPIVAAGAVLAEKIYQKTIPIVDKLEENPFEIIKIGDRVKIDSIQNIIEIYH